MEQDVIKSLQSKVEEAAEFFKNKKIIIDLWQDKSSKNKISSNQFIEKFKLEQSRKIELNNLQEIDKYISLLNEQAKNLRDNIGTVIEDNEESVNSELLEAIDIIYGQIERFTSGIEQRTLKFLKQCRNDEKLDIEKAADEFFNILKKCLDVIFDESISAIYRGIKMNGNPIYDILLNDVNTFLKNISVYTVEIKINDKINYDICDDAGNYSSKETEDYELDDCICDIIQYPYFWGNHLLSSGKVHAWRLAK